MTISVACTRCHETKAEGDFPHAKGRRHSWCRACNNAAKSERRLMYRQVVPRKKRIATDYVVDGLVVCSKCGASRHASHYQKGGAGWCRSCRAALETARRRSLGVAPRNFSVVSGDTKQCVLCRSFRPFADFSTSERGRAGRAAACKTCVKRTKPNNENSRGYTAAYRLRHPERWRASHRVHQFERKQRAKTTSDGTVTDAFLSALYGQEACAYCSAETPRIARTADHVTPLIKGGAHSASNMVMACRSCNGRKRDKELDEFLKELQQ